jgi:hypothetical protein
MPAQVRYDDGMVAGEFSRQGRPHIAGFAVAMEENDCRALPTDPHINVRTLGPHDLRAEVCREWLNLRGGGQRQRKDTQSRERNPQHLASPR